MRRCLSTLVILLVGLALSPAQTSAADPRDGAPMLNPETWLNNSEGLVTALESIDKDKSTTFVLYFYASWCGYCRQFEKELLSDPKVDQFLAKGLAVKIEPEHGASEDGIARYYRVEGYPSFFVFGTDSGRMIRIERHKRVAGRPQLLSPQEFISLIKETAQR